MGYLDGWILERWVAMKESAAMNVAICIEETKRVIDFFKKKLNAGDSKTGKSKFEKGYRFLQDEEGCELTNLPLLQGLEIVTNGMF